VFALAMAADRATIGTAMVAAKADFKVDRIVH
jgi:hypothetical protein